CINFMNLSTIRAMERSKEVGLRKVMGALKKNLVWQFIGESILITILSCVLAILLLKLAMPAYNELLGYQLTVSWTSPHLYIFVAAVIVVAGFLAGSYPAFFLSSFSPVDSITSMQDLQCPPPPNKSTFLFAIYFCTVGHHLSYFASCLCRYFHSKGNNTAI
ncbi:MAG: FtsX-like permease family protein, partial [Sphingobacteriales bacterium]